MSKCIRWIAAVCLAGASCCGVGQTSSPKYVPEGEAAQHLLTHVDPRYPAIAKSARLQGTVVLEVQVDAAGIPTKVDPVGGPPMLRGAAIEAVQQWRYTPFQTDGVAAPAHLLVTVPFSLGIPPDADGVVGQEFFPKSDLCRAYLRNRQWPEAKATCRDALTLAKRFTGRENSTNTLRLAYELDGQALAFSGDMNAALEQMKAAVAIANKSLTARDAEYAEAYGLQAVAEQALGQNDAADHDFSTAESSYRSAIEHLPKMSAVYDRQLARTLMRHAGLAEQLGDKSRAQTMRAEGEALDPPATGGSGGSK